MSREENVRTAEKLYEALASKDHEAAASTLAEDVETITPGRGSESGSITGRGAAQGIWSVLDAAGFAISPRHMIADDERVVVLAQFTVAGVKQGGVDILLFRDGLIAKHQRALVDTTSLDDALAAVSAA